MKTLAVVVVAAALALLWYMRRPSSHAAPASTTAAAAQGTSGAQPTSVAPAKRPPEHVTKLTPEERRAVADRIANAQAARAATRAPAAPKLPDRAALDPSDQEGFKTTIKAAMHEVLPMLADCYSQAGSSVPSEITVRAHLRLTGDPDIGTLIDADETTDTSEARLPAGFDDCLRSTLQTLELPPLAEGDEVKVTYPFVFRGD
jgi:hypothetical protein